MELNTTVKKPTNVSKWLHYMKNNKGAHTLELLCICRTSIMRIYLLSCHALVEADKPMEEVVACGVKIGPSLIVREVVLKGRAQEFLGEEIDLVQEQDLRSGFQYVKERKERDERTIEVLRNHRELHIESKRVRAPCIRF